jgi:hypothetical protein
MVGSMLCVNESQSESVDMDDIFDFWSELISNSI